MSTDFPKLCMMGERSILVEFRPKIDQKRLKTLLALKNTIQDYYIKQNVEVINTYSSLLINYHPNIEDVYSEVSVVKRLLSGPNIGKNSIPLLFELPVCYHPKFGIDLEVISLENQLDIEEIISLHCRHLYTVFFTGFLPGFLYLGGLDKKLKISRKKIPRLMVEKGAVGIGEDQTGIYPKDSPGGWQIIGNCPLGFFDPDSVPPSPFSPGDKVRFFPVSLQEYEDIRSSISAGKYQLQSDVYEE
ncbi:5-oxoprolinase subunit PxpB [soil metagenome]